MNIQQALMTRQVEQVIVSHTQQNIVTSQTEASCETHGGRVDFPFVMTVVIFYTLLLT